MIKSDLDRDIAAHFKAARERAADLLDRAARLVRQGDITAASRLDTEAWHELRLEHISGLATHPQQREENQE